MTVRTAELVVAIFLALASIALMVKASENNIFWIPERGPGAGAWPFWLGAGMLICCGITLIRWVRRRTPESRSEEVFMDGLTVKIFAITAGSLFVMIFAIHFIGTYFSIMLFLLFYMRFVGRHSWAVTLPLVVALPIGTFFFFDVALKIPLPKGYAEPLFYPIYRLVY